MNNESLKERIELVDKAGENGRVFGVSFVKKDGSLREMTCRLGVTKHLHGGEDSTSHIPKYINVFDMNKEAYRKINAETLKEIRFGGETYMLEEEETV